MMNIERFNQIVKSIEDNNLTMVLMKQSGVFNKQSDSKLFDLTTKERIPFFVISSDEPVDESWVYFFEKNNKTYVKKVDKQTLIDDFYLNIQMPSITQLAKNVVSQAVDTVKTAVTTGQVFTPFEDLTNRLKVCNQCEFLVEKRCIKCGCFMEYKAKLISASCPICLWHK